MTFRTLQNSTTADPSDVNDNFYHIGQGSRLPYAASMDPTTGVYSIGDSSYKWNNIHAQSIDYNTMTAWMEYTTYSGTPTPGTILSHFEINNIDGDNYPHYKMYFWARGNTLSAVGQVDMNYNVTQGAAGAGDYYDPFWGALVSMRIFALTSTYYHVADISFYFPTGQPRIAFVNDVHYGGGVSARYGERSCWLYATNTANTITKLYILVSDKNLEHYGYTILRSRG